METTLNRANLVSVQTVSSINEIPGCDNIVQAQVLGWKLITRRDEFKPGDKCVYFEIDSILPETAEWAQFMASKHFKVKTMKMRGTISQGLALPLSVVGLSEDLEIGTDVTEILKVTQYFEPEPSMRQGGSVGGFPNWIIKTDETRLQSLGMGAFDPDIVWTVTEKVDGTSATYFLRIDLDGVSQRGTCSRNLQLDSSALIGGFADMSGLSAYDEMDVKYGIHAAMDSIAQLISVRSVIIQGEIIGTGIQSNRLKLAEKQFRAFNVILDGVRLPSTKASELCGRYGILFVPILAQQKILQTTDEMVAYADGSSALNPQVKREGLVWRSADGQHSFKVISNAYLLKHEV